MFNVGDTTYFVFKGNWTDGHWRSGENALFCLYCSYYCFMPYKIININLWYAFGDLKCPGINQKWNVPLDCLVEEFSFQRFLMAHLDWYENTGKRITKKQFSCIAETLKADSSIGRTDRS